MDTAIGNPARPGARPDLFSPLFPASCPSALSTRRTQRASQLPSYQYACAFSRSGGA